MNGSNYDVIVIGGGAAGLFFAGSAAQRARGVLVLEGSALPGRKILISGGGRCNFTNLNARAEDYLTANPAFPKSALARFRPTDFIDLVKQHHIPFHEKKLGQMFCDRTAQDILDLLLDRCASAKVTIKTGATVKEITRPDRFRVETEREVYEAPCLVMASGGLSIPKAGATDLAYRVARKFDVGLVPVTPGLVPFTLSPADLSKYSELSGVSFDAEVSIGKRRFRESVLLTHRGLSGPAILQISSYWKPGGLVRINLVPELDEDMFVDDCESEVNLANWLSRYLPSRFARAWAAGQGEVRPLRAFGRRELQRISQRLRNWELAPAGTEGYAKAEVTCGGIDTRELSSQTMECRRIPGLYFIGEAVDVTGHLGGYNFQWAWASAHAAAQSL